MPDFDESAHPRDQEGRFASGEGGLATWARVSAKHSSSFRGALSGAQIRDRYGPVPARDIREVHEHDGSTGLKAIVHKLDGKQVHIYTDEHVQRQSDAKFARSVEFSGALQTIRERAAADLKSPDPKTRAAATIVGLVDQHVIRAGGSAAEEKTGSVGVTTLRAEHIKERSDGLHLEFKGKGGLDWNVAVHDRALAGNVRSFARGKAAGERVFPTTSAATNDYLRKIGGSSFTLKDFRTHHANAIVHGALAAAPRPASLREAKANVKAAIEKAAAHLGHDAATCRSDYVNPRLIDGYLAPHAMAAGAVKVRAPARKARGGGQP